MKILLLALQRTGSKLVHSNIQHYIETLGNTCKLIEGETTQSYWLEPRNYVGAKIKDGDVEFYKHHNMNFTDVFLNRIPVLQTLNKDISVKVHYNNGITPELLEMAKEFDHVVILRRRDMFQQLLSLVLSVYSTTWTNQSDQQRFIDHTIKKPVRINEIDWRNFVIQFTKASKDDIEGATIVYFEDLLKITDPLEYCTALGLSPRNFKLDDNDFVEFGEDKFKLITNVDRLRMIFDEETLT